MKNLSLDDCHHEEVGDFQYSLRVIFHLHSTLSPGLCMLSILFMSLCQWLYGIGFVEDVCGVQIQLCLKYYLKEQSVLQISKPVR